MSAWVLDLVRRCKQLGKWALRKAQRFLAVWAAASGCLPVGTTVVDFAVAQRVLKDQRSKR